MNNNYDFEINNNLRGIENNTRGMKTVMEDKLFLEVHGKEAYLEMVEKRRFYKTLFWCGVGAFTVGFFGVGLYISNWSMSLLFEKIAQAFMNLF